MASTDGKDAGADASAEPAGVVDQGVPVNLHYAGIAVGLVMLAGGFAVLIFNQQLYSVGALLICVGFGIALAVFGARANGTLLNFNVVGGGALAIVLYLLLYNFPMRLSEGYVRGKIEQTNQLVNVVGTAGQSFFVGRPRQNSDFEFVIFESELDSPQMYFYFQFPEGSMPKELYIGCIDSALVREAMRSDRDVVLSLEMSEPFQLIDHRSARSIGKLNKTRCSNTDTDTIPSDQISLMEWMSIDAHAGEIDPVLLKLAIVSLESEDASLRDHARTQIASLTRPEDFAVVADEWDVDISSYRADLGRLVGWSAAIERDRRTAVYIAESLPAEKLRYLAQLPGQGDFTLRQFSTEVLHRLLETTSWPSGPEPLKAGEIVEAVSEVLRNPDAPVVMKPGVDFSPQNRLYNVVVAIGFAECNIGSSVRPALISAMSGLARELTASQDSPKTLGRLQHVLAELKSCPT